MMKMRIVFSLLCGLLPLAVSELSAAEKKDGGPVRGTSAGGPASPVPIGVEFKKKKTGIGGKPESLVTNKPIWEKDELQK